MALQGEELFTRDGVGAACLNGELGAGGHIEVGFDPGEELIELLRAQGGGCAAADVDRLEPEPELACKLRGMPDLVVQQGQIFVDQLLRLLDALADEGAVIAPRRAERYADVQGERPLTGACDNRALVAAHLSGEVGLFITDIQRIGKIPARRLFPVLICEA